jgi:D-amino peptidase
MKVYISADMEGIAGITAVAQTNPVGEPEYARSCELMTGEVNAACEGAIAAGARQVLVNDSHWNMRNIIHEQLPPSVRLIRGSPKPLSMNQGLDASFKAAAFVGYHGPIGARDAILDHSYSPSTLYEVRINGEACSEARINAAVAGSFGVPVILLTGDQTACADARSFLPWVQTVEVKTAIGRYAADSLSPLEARAAVRAGMERALGDLSKSGAKPYRFAPPIALELTLTTTSKADMAELVPGCERTGGRSVRYTADDFLTIFRVFRVFLTLGGSVE